MSEKSLRTWRNGDSGAYVKEVIEHNFNILNEKLNNRCFSKSFTTSDWDSGIIRIDYYEHRFSNPSPSIYFLYNGVYLEVCGGFTIDSKNNIFLESDMPFEGKVVVR